MSELERIKNEIKKSLPVLKDKYKVKSLGVFGSYVRGKQKKRSDVDILVEFEEAVSFFDFLALERDISKIIGRKVDLVMKTALKPIIGKHILEEVVYL